MDLIDLIGQRPVAVALAGPNGAGKSTFYDAHLSDIGLHFVNADVLALSLGIDAYAAAAIADKIRRDFVSRRQSFIFETVFSDPVGEKLEFLKSAERSGFAVFLIFIGIASPELSNARVAMRAASGGHDVPLEKLNERYQRTMHNLWRALAELSNVEVYDHSDLDVGYRLIATRENRGPIQLHKPTPAWLRKLLR
jgi:predicted ABC-type ATPase